MTNTAEKPITAVAAYDLLDKSHLSKEEQSAVLKAAVAEGDTFTDFAFRIAEAQRKNANARQSQSLLAQLAPAVEHEVTIELPVKGSGFDWFDEQYFGPNGVRITRVRVLVRTYLEDADEEPYLDVRGWAHPLTKTGKVSGSANAGWISLPDELAAPIMGRFATT